MPFNPGWIEFVVFYGGAMGLALWALWVNDRALHRLREAKRRAAEAEAEAGTEPDNETETATATATGTADDP